MKKFLGLLVLFLALTGAFAFRSEEDPVDPAPADAAPPADTGAAPADPAPAAPADPAPAAPVDTAAPAEHPQPSGSIVNAPIDNVQFGDPNAMDKAFNPADKLAQLKGEAQALLPTKPSSESLKARIIGKGLSILQDCAEGRGRMAALQSGCELVLNAMEFGSKMMELLDASIDDSVDWPRITGHVDLSDFLGGRFPSFSFKLDLKRGAGIGLTLTADDAVRISLADILRKIVPSGLGLGPITDRVIDSAGLNNIALNIAEVGLNVKPFGIRISGYAEFLGKINFAIVAAKIKGKTLFALDLFVPGSVIENALTAVLGDLKKIVSVFSITKLSVTLASGTADLAEYPALAWDADTDLEKGIALSFSGRFDPNAPNPLGRMLASFLKGSFRISLVLRTGSFMVALKLPEVVFSSRAKLYDSKLKLVAGISPPGLRFGMETTLELKPTSDLILFTASLEARMHDPSVEASLIMKGAWKGAFGIRKLTIANLAGAVAISARPPWLTMIMLGGEMSYGDPNDDPISGSMYFRIDTENPLQNWYYGKVGRLTVGQIFRHLFGVSSLPRILAESGFPLGCSSSYALADAVAPNGEEIPMGYRFKGRLQILGWKADADVILSPLRFKFYIAIDPIKLGSLLVISKSKEVQNQGPHFHLEGSVSPLAVFADIEGYAKVFLFESYIKVYLDNEKFRFKLMTQIFYIFDADIEASANYGSLSELDFAFKVSINTYKTKQKIIEFIRELKEKAGAALEAAKKKVNDAQQAAYRTADNMCDGGKACGFKCNVHLLEEAGFQISKKDHDLFDVSVDEWENIKEQLLLAELNAMTVEEMENEGYLVSEDNINHEAHLVELQALADEQAEDGHAALLEFMEDNEQAFLELDDEAMLTVQDRSGRVEAYRAAWFKSTFSKVGNAFKSAGNHIASGFKSAGNKISSGFKSFGNKVSSGFHNFGNKVSSGFKSFGNKVSSGFQNFGNKVSSGFKSFGNKVSSGFKHFGNQVANFGRNAISSIANAGCKAGAGLCKAGCATGSGIVRFGGMTLDAAKGVLTATQKVVGAALSLIDKFLSSFDLGVSFGGSLNTQAFSFFVKFALRVGSINLDFGLSIDLRFSSILKMAELAFQKIKNYILEKTGLGKYL